MCGLFGFAGNLQKTKRNALLTALCLLNQERGKDSVGIAVIDRTRRARKVFRHVGRPIEAVKRKPFIQIADDQGQVWIGHTRWATRGEISIDNAHPFETGNTILAHNGVVTVDKELIDRCDGKDFAVDSQYLAYLVERDGVVGEISGSACLTYSQRKSAIDVTLIRHNNPLSCAVLADKRGIVWSSDKTALEMALAMARVYGVRYVPLQDGKRYDVYLDGNGKLSDVVEGDNGIRSKYKSIGFRTESGLWDDSPAWQFDAARQVYMRSHGAKTTYRYTPPKGYSGVQGCPNAGAPNPYTSVSADSDTERYGDALQRMAEQERLEREYYGTEGDTSDDIIAAEDSDIVPGYPADVESPKSKLPRELR
jgi:hypothetical protein